MNKKDLIKKAALITPSKKQLEWQNNELSALVFFGLNTYVPLGNGHGYEVAGRFNPSRFDADSWCNTLKSGHFNTLILTCKYNDGFCLWPSEYTDYSVKYADWKDGNGDMVKEVSEACRRHGMKFGVYLSLLDKHERSHGKGKTYDEFFKNQLTELLSNYGKIDCVWLDDTLPIGQRGQNYDIEGYIDIIRKLQPDAVISKCGPDIRWGGNELGVTRSSEFSVLPDVFLTPKYRETDLDLGSIKKLAKAEKLVWYPAEFFMHMRASRYYNADENEKLTPLHKLVTTYIKTVGGNASLVLGVSPDAYGLFSQIDVENISLFGKQIDRIFKKNYAEKSITEADTEKDANHSADKINDKNDNTYWHSGDCNGKINIKLTLANPSPINYIVLAENTATGQQIEKFTVRVRHNNNKYKKIYSGTTIGHKKIIPLDKSIISSEILLTIEKTRCFATLSKFEVY